MNKVRSFVMSAVWGAGIMLVTIASMYLYGISNEEGFRLDKFQYGSFAFGAMIYMALVVIPLTAFKEDKVLYLRVVAALLLPILNLFFFWDGKVSLQLATLALWLIATATAYQFAMMRLRRQLPGSRW